MQPLHGLQEGDGISPTAIREIMLLRELKHDNIVHLDAVHLYRKVLPCSSLINIRHEITASKHALSMHASIPEIHFGPGAFN